MKLNKQNKQYLIYGIIALVVLFLIILMMSRSSDNSSNIIPKTLSEKERYAMFEADVTCSLANSDNTEQVWMAINEIGKIAEKYGYTGEDIEVMKAKYSADLEFQTIALNYMKDMCPEVVEQFISSQ